MDVYLFSVFFFFFVFGVELAKKRGRRLIESVSCFFSLILVFFFGGARKCTMLKQSDPYHR